MCGSCSNRRGCRSTLIADRTRSFFGYLKGAADYETFTWDQLVATADDPFVAAPLNTTITFASSADDLVSFYEQALRGDFFEHDETLKLLHSLLSTGDVVWTIPLPLGATSFGKGGSFDVPKSTRCPRRARSSTTCGYFSFILNWTRRRRGRDDRVSLLEARQPRQRGWSRTPSPRRCRAIHRLDCRRPDDRCGQAWLTANWDDRSPAMRVCHIRRGWVMSNWVARCISRRLSHTTASPTDQLVVVHARVARRPSR